MGKTQEPQPYSRTVRIGMISVVPEEEGEDKNMESYGEEGYEQGYEGEYTDTEGEEAPPLSIPLPTRATRVGKGIIMDSIKAPPSILT